jgi:hypothetical protein
MIAQPAAITALSEWVKSKSAPKAPVIKPILRGDDDQS